MDRITYIFNLNVTLYNNKQMLAKLQAEYKIERVNMIHLSISSQICEM